METTPKARHIGRNITRLRELRGLKQEALAIAIGVSQQTISNIENSEKVEDDKLQLIAKELGVSVEAIKNFSEDNVITYFNNFYDNASGQSFGNMGTNNYTFNPIEKLVEVFEENKELYKQLLQAEKDKTTYLEKLYNAK